MPERSQIFHSLDPEKKEIRLLKILASVEPGAMIECELSVVSLDLQPAYKALSYVWGQADVDTATVYLNGSRFTVTKNLNRALLRLRGQQISTPVWIDALCIDQSNLQERTLQVQLMRRIYEQSLETIVYLGEYEPDAASEWYTRHDHERCHLPGDGLDLRHRELFMWKGDENDDAKSGSILDRIGTLNASWRSEQLADCGLDSVTIAISFILLVSSDIHLTDNMMFKSLPLMIIVIRAFESLASLPWVRHFMFQISSCQGQYCLTMNKWKRIWVVQEVVLPASVSFIFSDHMIPLHTLITAATHWQRHTTTCCANQAMLESKMYRESGTETMWQHISAIEAMSKQWKKGEKTTILPLLRTLYLREASDARDRIYGLLGLVRNWGGGEALIPRYDVHDQVLYDTLAFRAISASNTLDILYCGAFDVAHTSLGLQGRTAAFQDLRDRIDDDAKDPSKLVLKEHEHDPIDPTRFSWVPNWNRMRSSVLSEERIVPFDLQEHVDFAKLFRAHADTRAILQTPLYTASQHVERTCVLSAAAHRVARISKINRTLLVQDPQYIYLDLSGLPPLETPYLGREGAASYSRALSRALCGEIFVEPYKSKIDYMRGPKYRRAENSYIELFHDYIEMELLHGAEFENWESDLEDRTTCIRFPRAHKVNTSLVMNMEYRQRDIIHLDSGHVGSAAGTEVGDEVMVLFGASTPFVLRRLGELELEGLGKEIVWGIVEDACVIGIMDGEFAQECEREGRSPELTYII